MSLRKRRASPQTLRAATRLARHAEWAKGFWLTYLFSIAPNQVHILQDRLAEKLTSIGREQRILRPATPQALEGILGTILEHPNVGCVWVEAIRDPEFEQGAWAEAWFNLILRMNERRELLREMLTGGLILVAHPELKSAFRNAGPDLWSIRTMTFELPPGPAGDAGGQVAARFDQHRPPQFVDVELLDKDMARWARIVDEYSSEDQARVFMQLAARLRESGRPEEAAQASNAAVQRYRNLATARPEAFQADLAQALIELGRDLGERQEFDREHADAALDASQEAVTILRALVREHPDDDSLRLRFADALWELGHRWSAVGDTKNVLPVLEEAVALYRASNGTSPRGLASLAQALARLGGELLGQERPEAALPVLKEAVDRLRTLGEAFFPYLAGHLINLGICLNAIGRREEGLEATEESVSIYRRLNETQVEGYVSHLARALHNLGNQLHDLGRRSDAVAAAEEAVALSRNSVANSETFLPDLATALTAHGAHLHDVGRQAEALVVATEAVDACRRLVRSHGEAYLGPLADALTNLALFIDSSGDRDEALGVLEESVNIYRSLATRQPEIFRARLGTALTNLSLQLARVARHDEALIAAREAVEIRRDLAAAHPGRFLHELAGSLSNFGLQLAESGSSQEALSTTTEAVELYRRLTDTWPDAYFPHLASVLTNLGSRLRERGRHEEALQAAEESVAIRRQLAATEPNVFLPVLAAELSNLGVQLNNLGRYDDALATTQEAIDILRSQANSYAGGLPELSIVLHNLSKNLIALSRWEDALPVAEEAEHIRRELSTRWPGKFRQAHATSLVLLGECRRALDQPALAVEALAEALRELKPVSDMTPLEKATAAALRDACREAEIELPQDLRERIAQLLE